MLPKKSLNKKEIAIFYSQLLMQRESEGGTPEETEAFLKHLNISLGNIGEEMPFSSCHGNLPEFNLFQETTIKKMLAIEKELYLFGYDGGLIMFEEAVREFFQLEHKYLLELEKDDAAFFETFQNEYLLKYGELFFKGALNVLKAPALPSHNLLLYTAHGLCYSNTLYQLYTYLYENASKVRKRTIQSIMQKQGVTVKDLKKCSRMK